MKKEEVGSKVERIIKYTVIEVYPSVLKTKGDFLNLSISILYYLTIIVMSLKRLIFNGKNFLAKIPNISRTNDLELLKESRELSVNYSEFNTSRLSTNAKSFEQKVFYGKEAYKELEENRAEIEKVDNGLTLNLAKGFILKKKSYFLVQDDVKDDSDIITRYYVTLEFNQAAIIIYNFLKKIGVIK